METGCCHAVVCYFVCLSCDKNSRNFFKVSGKASRIILVFPYYVKVLTYLSDVLKMLHEQAHSLKGNIVNVKN